MGLFGGRGCEDGWHPQTAPSVQQRAQTSSGSSGDNIPRNIPCFSDDLLEEQMRHVTEMRRLVEHQQAAVRGDSGFAARRLASLCSWAEGLTRRLVLVGLPMLRDEASDAGPDQWEVEMVPGLQRTCTHHRTNAPPNLHPTNPGRHVLYSTKEPRALDDYTIGLWTGAQAAFPAACCSSVLTLRCPDPETLF